MSMSTLLVAAVVVLLSNVHLVYLQDASVDVSADAKLGAGAQAASSTPQSLPSPTQNSAVPDSNVGVNLDAQKWEEWKKNPLYLPSFEPDVISIPDTQKDFVNNMAANDMELFREILRDAIDKKNTFAPSVQLMWKYTGKLLGNFIRNRQEEQQINPRKEPIPAFFEAVAHLAELVLDRSDEIKREMGYNKNSVNTEELYRRVDNALKYIQRVIATSPTAAYLQWDQLLFFKDDPTNPQTGRALIEEMGDLTAQFRGMGYDKCIFVARRIINLLRLFSKGRIPSVKDV